MRSKNLLPIAAVTGITLLNTGCSSGESENSTFQPDTNTVVVYDEARFRETPPTYVGAIGKHELGSKIIQLTQADLEALADENDGYDRPLNGVTIETPSGVEIVTDNALGTFNWAGIRTEDIIADACVTDKDPASLNQSTEALELVTKNQCQRMRSIFEGHDTVYVNQEKYTIESAE